MAHSSTAVAAAQPQFVSACPAHDLRPDQRRTLALQALAGTLTITALAHDHGVSRKFVYQQAQRAQTALDQAFAPAPAADDTVLFYLPVTQRWLRQVVLVLVLVCHSSYRGVLDFFATCLGWRLSLGTIHNILHATVAQARQHTAQVPLGGVRVGLLDEIFQAQQPVLVGVDADSSYCFLLSLEEHRDAETWGVRLLELHERGCQPEAFVADFGTGLRAGAALALPAVCCRGDVFHALQTVTPVVTALESRAYEVMHERERCERKLANHRRRHGRGHASLAQRLRNLRPAEARAIALADDVALLARWLREDLLAVAGPCHAERCALYDFLVAELRARVPQGGHRLAPVCQFLEKHRDHLLAFAAQLDEDLAALAAEFQVAVASVRALLNLSALNRNSTRRWQREAALRAELGGRFYALQTAVAAVAEHTVRASSAAENLNSRLRNYFFLRHQLGPDYLVLLQFFLNHRRLARSARPERVGKSPAELLTGQEHPHWLVLLGYEPCCRN